MKRWQLGLLGAIISILAIFFIGSQINLNALALSLRQAQYGYIFVAMLLLLVGLFTRAVRWRGLLSGALPLGRAFSIMNVAYLLNGILPLRVGELARVYLATRNDPPVPMLKTASTIVVERLLDLLAVLVLLGLAFTAGSVPDELRAAAIISMPLAVAGFLVLVFLSSQRQFAHRILAVLVGTKRPATLEKFSGWLDHFLDGLSPLTHPRQLGDALFWTGVSWGFSTAAGYIAMLAFYPQASWSAAALFIAAVSLAVAIPAVPGNLGPYELTILLALGATGYGEPPDTAAAFALVVHGMNLGLYTILGLLGLAQEGISFGQLSQSVQAMRQTQMVAQDVTSGE